MSTVLVNKCYEVTRTIVSKSLEGYADITVYEALFTSWTMKSSLAPL